jgi:serine/threonine protein kinase
LLPLVHYQSLNPGWRNAIKSTKSGVGAVFRAYDSQLKRWVAVKRLMTASEAAKDKNIAVELRREADALASLRNPNIVTIFDVASDEEGLFMVMELLQGEDLADVVARGPLPYDDFKELASQTLEALLAAHQHHILHRDIKPENIKVERLPGGRLQSKVIDFGLARAGLGARKQTEDQEGTVMGSIYYMAPEQLTREPVDERTDLYSLGCVFYEALSGKKAFDAESMAEVIDKHINHDVVALHIIAPHVPQWLGAWCARLMAQKPDDRPANAQQAIEEFRACLSRTRLRLLFMLSRWWRRCLWKSYLKDGRSLKRLPSRLHWLPRHVVPAPVVPQLSRGSLPLWRMWPWADPRKIQVRLLSKRSPSSAVVWFCSSS